MKNFLAAPLPALPDIFQPWTDIGFAIKAKRKEQIPSYKYLGGGTIKKWSRCYDLEEA